MNHPDADGRTALWAAARAGDATSVKLCVLRVSQIRGHTVLPLTRL